MVRAAIASTAAVVVMVLSLSAHAATIISTFDTDAEGWTGIPGEGSLSYLAAGGNPGGHVRVTDIGVGGPLGSGAIAGPAFSGDLSAFDRGSLSVDMATFAGGGGTFPIFGTVRIAGSGNEAFFDLTTTAPGGAWQSYLAPLTAAAWGVSPADWTAILASVTEIAISTDAFDGADTIGIDNFSLESNAVPVPEPGAVALLGLGLAGLALGRHKKA